MTLHGAGTTEGVVTKASPRGVEETVERLTELLRQKDLTVFAVVDHSGAAQKVGLENARHKKLVLFGNPAGRHARHGGRRRSRRWRGPLSPRLGRRRR